MLDFLKTIDISDSVINRINNTYDDAMIYNLHMNAENCIGIILYMRKIGINNIDDLLIDKPEWFLKTTTDFISLFVDDKDLVNKINEDYDNVNI